MTKILALAGSTRKDSYNKTLLAWVARRAEAAGAEVTVVDLRDYAMPLYDGDLESEAGLPEKAAELKRLAHSADAFLIASPEYNGSLTAVLKNAIDWLSRPGAVEGSVFQDKVALLVSASPGGLGGLRGLRHLTEVLGNLGVFVLPGQRAVSRAHEAFDEGGEIKDEALRAQLEALAQTLVRTTERLNR